MYPITTTLENLRTKGACFEGYNCLVRSLQGKVFTDADAERESYIKFNHVESIPLSYIVESNGIDDALWALRASTATDKDMRLYAVHCARQVAHLSSDPRVEHCLEVAERHAYGKATDAELRAAWADAIAAAWAAADAVARAAKAAAREYQKELFLLMVDGNAPWQVEEKQW